MKDVGHVGLPLPPALQYIILVIWRACGLNFIMISALHCTVVGGPGRIEF